MKVHNISSKNLEKYKILKTECQQFLEESNGLPLIKSFPYSYPDVHKVKVRKKKTVSEFDEIFNLAFEDEYPSMRARSIIINDSENPNYKEPFYVLPSDGYKVMYAPTVENAERQFGVTLNEVKKLFEENNSTSVMVDLLRYTYKSGDLPSAILENSEIIVYNIPYFYVVRADMDY